MSTFTQKLLPVVLVVSLLVGSLTLASPLSAQSNAEDDLLADSTPPELENGALAIISEDPIINQLNKFTNVLDSADPFLESEIQDNLNAGVISKVDESIADPSKTSGETLDILRLPSRPISTEVVIPGVVKAELLEGTYYVQGLEDYGVYQNRVQVFMSIVEAEIRTFKFPIQIPEGSRAVQLNSKQILFVVDAEQGEVPIALIDSPWALDSDGNEIPVTQTLEDSELVIVVDARQAVLPVVVDPFVSYLSCWDGHPLNETSAGTAYTYLNGEKCPTDLFYYKHYYYPAIWESWGRFRVARNSGECSGLDPDDSPVPPIVVGIGSAVIAEVLEDVPDKWETIWPFGTIFDFQAACKAHDYCYDLGRVRYNNVRVFPNVSRRTCDRIFLNDMTHDCEHRRVVARPICYFFETAYYSGVTAGTAVALGDF